MYFLYCVILITLKNYNIQSVLKVLSLERRGKIKLGFKSRSNCLNMSKSYELSSQQWLASVRQCEVFI